MCLAWLVFLFTLALNWVKNVPTDLPNVEEEKIQKIFKHENEIEKTNGPITIQLKKEQNREVQIVNFKIPTTHFT